jgi:ankyrin repeat protein
MKYYSEHYYPSDKTNKLEELCGHKDGSDKEALLLIKQGADLHYRDMFGVSLLHRAAESGNINILAILDCQGADITCRDLLGRTPLLCASSQGHIRIIDYINKRCGLLFAADNHKNGPLHYAASHSTPETISFLLKSLDIDQKNSVGDTPLIAACSQRKWHNAKYLIENGADVNVCGDDKFTPLNYVLQGGDMDFMKLLLKQGVKVDTRDDKGNGLVHYAVTHNKLEMLQCLLTAGAPKDIKNNIGWTPLLMSCGDKKKHEAAKILIEAGADVNLTSLRRRSEPVVFKEINKQLKQIKMELDYCLELLPKQGATSLHIASYHGYSELVELLLEKGAHVNAKTKNGATPLHMAALQGNIDIVKMLFGKGANIELETDSKICHLNNGDSVITFITKPFKVKQVIQRNKNDVRIYEPSRNREIIVFKELKDILLPGTYCRTQKGLKPIPSDLESNKGLKMVNNHLSNLVPLNNCVLRKRDDKHDFPDFVEKECGDWARVVIRNDKNNSNQITDNAKKFTMCATIPGRIDTIEIDDIEKKAVVTEQQSGVFEYKIIKKLDEEKGACAHRFFAPKGMVGAEEFGAKAQNKRIGL